MLASCAFFPLNGIPACGGRERVVFTNTQLRACESFWLLSCASIVALGICTHSLHAPMFLFLTGGYLAESLDHR